MFDELEGVKNVPVEIDRNMEGKSGNTLIRLVGNLTSEGKVKTVSRPRAGKRETVKKEYYSIEGPASVKDVMQLATVLHAQQMMSNYNT